MAAVRDGKICTPIRIRFVIPEALHCFRPIRETIFHEKNEEW